MGKLGRCIADKFYKEKSINEYCKAIDEMLGEKDKFISLRQKIGGYTKEERTILRLECNSNVIDTEKAIVFDGILPTILYVPLIDIVKDYAQDKLGLGLVSMFILIGLVGILSFRNIVLVSSLVMKNREYLYIIQIIDEVNNKESENNNLREENQDTDN